MSIELRLAFLLLAIPLTALLYRLIEYFIDRNNLRRFHSLTPLCGLTNLGYIIHNTQAQSKGKTRTEALHEAHRQHSVIRLGPKRLSFASVEAIKDIYGTGTKCIKGDQYITPGGVPNLLTVVDRQAHAVKRKRLSAAFATSHLLDWEHKVQDKVDRLVLQLGRRADTGKPVDMRFWSNLFTIDAIMDIALSQHSGLMERADDTVVAESSDGSRYSVRLLECLRSVNRANEPIVWSPTGFSVLKRFSFLIPTYAKQWGLAACWPDVVRHLMGHRLAMHSEGEQLDDLFTCLLRDSKGEHLSLDIDEVLAEVSHFLDAGSDTTSIALTHVLYFLAKHPAKLERLRLEIDTCSEGTLTAVDLPYEQVRSLPYLQACLNESMRLRPALSAGMQRRTPPGGMTIAGEWIPGHLMVSVPAHTAHRDAAIFPDPDTFVPERWLDEEAKAFQKYILTFSAGGRVCIGKNITFLEQSLLVAAIVRRFDFELPSDDWKMQHEEFFNLWPVELPLKFSRRADRPG